MSSSVVNLYAPGRNVALDVVSIHRLQAAQDAYARAQALFEQTLPLYRQTSEKLGVILHAIVLAILGHLAAARCDFPAASNLLNEGQALVKEFRDEDLAGYERLQQLLTVAYMDNFLGQVRLSQADNDAAAQLFTDGLTVARRARDRISILISLYDLALASQAQGDLAGAAGHLKEGLAIAAEAGDETTAAYYLEALAAVAGQQNNPQRAVRLLSAARSQLQANGWAIRAPRHDPAQLLLGQQPQINLRPVAIHLPSVPRPSPQTTGRARLRSPPRGAGSANMPGPRTVR